MLSGTGRMVKVAAVLGEKVLVIWPRSLSGGRAYARWSGGPTGERRVCKDDAESDHGCEHVAGGPRQVGFRVWRWVCFLTTLVWWLGWFRILVWKWFFFSPQNTECIAPLLTVSRIQKFFLFWTFEAFVYSFSSILCGSLQNLLFLRNLKLQNSTLE